MKTNGIATVALYANAASLLFTSCRLNPRWRSARRVLVSGSGVLREATQTFAGCFFRSPLRVAAYFDSHKRRHYFQRRVDGGWRTAANTPGLFSSVFSFLPVSSLALMPRRSGWSCSLRETSGCSSLSRMLMRPSLRLLLTLLLLQVLRTLCRPTDEGMTLFALLAPPFIGNAVNVGSV